MSDAEDINLYTVPTHDPAECDEFMARLRRERNQARNIDHPTRDEIEGHAI